MGTSLLVLGMGHKRRDVATFLLCSLGVPTDPRWACRPCEVRSLPASPARPSRWPPWCCWPRWCRVSWSLDYGRFAVALTIVTLGLAGADPRRAALVTRYVPAAPPDGQLPLARALGGQLAREASVQLCVLAGIAALVTVVFAVDVPWTETIAVGTGLLLNVVATIALLVVLGLGRAGAWSARYPIQTRCSLPSCSFSTPSQDPPARSRRYPSPPWSRWHWPRSSVRPSSPLPEGPHRHFPMARSASVVCRPQAPRSHR